MLKSGLYEQLINKIPGWSPGNDSVQCQR